MRSLLIVLCLASAAQAQDCSSGQCKLAPKVKAVVQNVVAAPTAVVKRVASVPVAVVASRPRLFRRGCFAR